MSRLPLRRFVVWLRSCFPQPTLRLRFTLLYGGLFAACGLGLLALVYLLSLLAPGPVSGSRMSVGVLGHLESPHVQNHPVVLYGFALTIMTIVSLCLAWPVAGRVLRPLRAITRTAGEISASDLDRRLALSGPNDELKRLGDTFDSLLGRLETAFEAQRRFVANASHELRTPLTYERTLLEVTLADPMASAETLRETCTQLLALEAKQERLLEALLTLSRGQAGLQQRQLFDLASLTGDVLASRGAEMLRRGLKVRSDLAPAPAAGDPRLVERLVGNLVENALRHNVECGRIEVRTETRSGQALICVTNTGPVVPAEDIERLFEPFRSAETDRTRRDGHGLGLSIVRAIADAHGGAVTVEPQSEGGLHVEVAFPAPSSVG